MFHKRDREREPISIPHITNERGQSCTITTEGQRLIRQVRNGDVSLEDLTCTSEYVQHEVTTYFQKKGRR